MSILNTGSNMQVIHVTGCHWYAYKHINGTIHPKRFFSKEDVIEATASDFVSEVRGPVEGTREDALNLFQGDEHAETV